MQSSSENTHGKNSIEAAADTTVEALHAVKDKLEDDTASGSDLQYAMWLSPKSV